MKTAKYSQGGVNSEKEIDKITEKLMQSLARNSKRGLFDSIEILAQLIFLFTIRAFPQNSSRGSHLLVISRSLREYVKTRDYKFMRDLFSKYSMSKHCIGSLAFLFSDVGENGNFNHLLCYTINLSEIEATDKKFAKEYQRRLLEFISIAEELDPNLAWMDRLEKIISNTIYQK